MSTTQKRAFLLMLAVCFLLCLWIVLPVWVPLFLGIVLAVTVKPWHDALIVRYGKPRTLAAVLTGVALVMLLAVVALLLWVVARELIPLLTTALTDLRHGGLDSLYHGHTARVLRGFGLGQERIAGWVTRLSEYAATNVAGVIATTLSATSSSILAIFFTAITCYYLLADGNRLLAWGEKLSPLPGSQTRSLYREFRDVVRGTLIGTGVTALAQGGLATIGYVVFGVPHALMWGALTGMGSLIPGLGTALVWVPIGVVLIAIGPVWKGVAVLVFGGVVIVGAADYILRPLVVGSQVRLHSLLVFIAIFGGLEAAGLIGLLLGPLFLALFVAMLRIYDREYRAAKPGTPGGVVQPVPKVEVKVTPAPPSISLPIPQS